MKSHIKQAAEFELRLEGCGADGEAIGRIDGRAVFVPFGAPGDLARISIGHVGKRKVTGRLLDVIEPGPGRTKPVCPVFEKCGGCQLQHLKYQAQLDFKARVVKDAMRSIAGFTPKEKYSVAPSPQQTEYRNRGQYPVARSGSKTVFGFFAPRSHDLVPTQRCILHHREMDEAVSTVCKWAGRKSIPIYDERLRSGWLRHVVVRRSHAKGEVLVTLVGTSGRQRDLRDLVKTLRKSTSSVIGLTVNINPANTNVILGDNTEVFWGKPWVEEHIGSLCFRLSTGSFFQVNTPQAEKLFDRVSRFCMDAGGLVVDAYCGVGAMTLALASKGLELIGIELSPQAISDARRASVDNSIKAVFHQGRVEKVLPRLVDDGLRPSVVILDPPRKGCQGPVLEAVARSAAERIAYVSCNPGSLARDLRILFDLGYELQDMESFDMFPHTAHVETFAGLKKTR